MSKIILTPVLFAEPVILKFITEKLNDTIGITANIENHEIDIESHYSSERSQYDALKIIQAHHHPEESKFMICTSVDLFIPIFTFVFGLAQLNGNIGIISSHRLENQYYGLPKDKNLLGERLAKETIHELGHLFGLRHCSQYKCVMAISNTAEEVDIKDFQYCSNCVKDLYIS